MISKNMIYYFKFLGAKLKCYYYMIILRMFYNRKPNKNGTFDLSNNPGFKDAHL